MKPVRLDGRSLTRAQLVAVAHGASVELAPEQLPAVQRAADFLAEQARREPHQAGCEIRQRSVVVRVDFAEGHGATH